jgi:hypothetical protein
MPMILIQIENIVLELTFPVLSEPVADDYLAARLERKTPDGSVLMALACSMQGSAA